jgi:hydroxyacylglutathione hydrolase
MNKKLSVFLKKLTVGQMGVNCYIAVDEFSREAVIIDPGDEASYIAEQLSTLDVKPIAILATHGHFDHVLAAFELQMIYQIPFCMSREDAFLLDRMSETAEHFLGHAIVEMPPKITTPLHDREQIAFGKSFLTVLSLSGHTPGSVGFYIKKQDVLFVGDTIFSEGHVGRTDFSYADPKKLDSSIGKIFSLPDATILYPGHGEETTVLKEKRYHGKRL